MIDNKNNIFDNNLSNTNIHIPDELLYQFSLENSNKSKFIDKKIILCDDFNDKEYSDINKIINLNEHHNLNKLNKLDKLDKLDELYGLDKLEKIEKIEKIEKKDNNENFDYINWNKYLNNKLIDIPLNNKDDLFYKFHIFKFIPKKNIKAILEKDDFMKILSKPYNYYDNKLLLKMLKNEINNCNDTNNIEIIEYYLYYCESSIIEKIHWSYFYLKYFNIFFDKINNNKKIIEIISLNSIYNIDFDKTIKLIIYSFCQLNEYKNIVIYNYLNNFNETNNNEQKYFLTDLPRKYKSISTNISENKIILPKKINYNDIEIITNLIINIKDDNKKFNKLLSTVNKNILLECIESKLYEQNIYENKIIKIIELFDIKKNNNTKNIKLFCKLLLNGYVYCIKKIWFNLLPKINCDIKKTIISIITEDKDNIFKVLLENNILHDYLYCKNNKVFWINILFKSKKIVPVLVSHKFNVPKKIILMLIQITSDKSLSYKTRNFNSMYKIQKNTNNIFQNIILFDLPINDDIISIFIKYSDDDIIFKLIKKNFNKIDINYIVGLILSNAKFNLLEKIFTIDPNIFNKDIYTKNINKYYKYINNKKKLSNIYLHNIKFYKQKINKSIVKYSLKFKKIILIKKIIKTNKYLLDLTTIKFNFFTRTKLIYNNKNIQTNIFKILKNNIDDWDKIYDNLIVCKNIFDSVYLESDDIVKIFNIHKNFCDNYGINFIVKSIIYLSFSEKINMLKQYLENQSEKIEYYNIKIIFRIILFTIDFDDFVSIDKIINISEKIKKIINFEFLVKLLFDYYNNFDTIKYLNYFGYFLPSPYYNNLIVILYIKENPYIVYHFLSKCNTIKEETFDYIKQYIDLSRQNNSYFYTKNQNIYNKIISIFKDKKNISNEIYGLDKLKVIKEIGDDNYSLLSNYKNDYLYGI